MWDRRVRDHRVRDHRMRDHRMRDHRVLLAPLTEDVFVMMRDTVCGNAAVAVTASTTCTVILLRLLSRRTL